MADNTTLNSMTGGDVIAADDIDGVKIQRVKIVEGADGTNDGDISSANPLPVIAASNTGVDIGDVDVTSIIPGVAATNLGKAEDATHTTADTGVMILGVANTADAGISGTTLDYTPIATDLAGAVHVMGKVAADAVAPVNPLLIGGRASTATPSAMSADGDLVGLWATRTGAQVVDGGIAHDAADAGNSIKVGAKAISTPAGLTLVAANDRTDNFADLDGLLLVKPYTSYGDILSERVSNTNGTSTALTVFGATAGAKNFITTIVAYNSSATAGYVDIRDGTAGSVLMTIPLPAGGGTAISFPIPLKQSTANTALAFDVSDALSTVYLSFIGFKSKVA